MGLGHRSHRLCTQDPHMTAASFFTVRAALLHQRALRCATHQTPGRCLDQVSPDGQLPHKAIGARKCRQAASKIPAEEAAVGAWGAYFPEHSGLRQPRQICLDSLHKAVCSLLLLPLILCHTERLQMGGNSEAHRQYISGGPVRRQRRRKLLHTYWTSLKRAYKSRDPGGRQGPLEPVQ